MENFTCPICGNQDSRFIGVKNGEFYCRRCINFKGLQSEKYEVKQEKTDYELSFNLSKEQSFISNKLIENFKNNISTLINAVCGSGKTEIVFGVISEALSNGKRVAFAIPRRDVVIELYPRINAAFNTKKTVSLYGGHTDDSIGDITILTTHQLFRFNKDFDLLIIDEIDAFPFKGDEVLLAIAKRSCRGMLVMMSATPNDDIVTEFKKPGHEILELNKRFHGHDLPVPVFRETVGIFKIIELISVLKRWQKERKQSFVFCATIKECELLFNKIKFLVKGGEIVHSKRLDRAKIIEDFKIGKINYLVTTAILERGVTIKNLQVVIFNADHELYDKGTLIQISGRVGRKVDAPEGEVIFIGTKKTPAIEQAIKEIKSKNASM